jgi:hypothetical protein
MCSSDDEYSVYYSDGSTTSLASDIDDRNMKAPSSTFCAESTAHRDKVIISHDPIGSSDRPTSRPDSGTGINTLNHIFVTAANTVTFLAMMEAIQVLPVMQLQSGTSIKLRCCQNGTVRNTS